MKGIFDVPAGTVRVRSARSAGLHSAPKTKAGSYLDLFTLNIERLRLKGEQPILAKQRSRIDIRMEQNSRKLDELRAAMLGLAQRVTDEERGEATNPGNRARPPSRKWRTVTAGY